MDELPGPVREKVQISPKLDSEHPLRSLANKYYTALVNGDLKSLEVLTDRYYEDVNLVFEISKNEMEWQVKSQSSYGLSGTFYLKTSLEKTPGLTNLSGRGTALVQPAPGWLFLAKDLHPKMLGASFACFFSAHTNPPEGQGHPPLPCWDGAAHSLRHACKQAYSQILHVVARKDPLDPVWQQWGAGTALPALLQVGNPWAAF